MCDGRVQAARPFTSDDGRARSSGVVVLDPAERSVVGVLARRGRGSGYC